MKRFLTVVAVNCVIFVGPQALATDSANQSMTTKWQMIGQIASCVKRRMSIDKKSSYKEALKVCKDEIKHENDNSPSGALVASDTQAKP